MNAYFQTANINVDFNNPNLVTDKYNNGFVFTRVSKGNMIQTRSLRIKLKDFEPNSENRRILTRTDIFELSHHKLPLENYNWEIHKLGKNFYSQKFGDTTMSASKIKEMFVTPNKSNMTCAFIFRHRTNPPQTVGYCLCYENSGMLHYAYPFYDLEIPKEQNIGISMLTKAILWAKNEGKKHFYLGSVTTPAARYKLQFEGLEWWDERKDEWNSDLTELKTMLT